MSRRRDQRIPVQLDARGVRSLPRNEIKAIMRGAEDLIAQGGRTLLCKILKGSRDKDVSERGLGANPAWGFYRALDNEEVMARIDWTILNGYLQIEYFGRLPLLTYTPAGLEIEIDSISDEYLARMRQMTGTEADVQFFEARRDTPRPTLWKLMEKIEATGDRSFIPLLTMWDAVAPKKVRARITTLLAVLERTKES